MTYYISIRIYLLTKLNEKAKINIDKKKKTCIINIRYGTYSDLTFFIINIIITDVHKNFKEDLL